MVEFGSPAPDVPYVRNYFKNERLYPALAGVVGDLIARERFELVHAQHVLTCLPSIEAAHQRGVPAVCTVRDYWPVCYWSDLLYSRDGTHLCPECSAAMMTRCIRPRGGLGWPLALPMIPYMRANLARKRTGLAAADAVIAVSSRIAADLRARAPELSRTRMETIHNPVDVAGLRARASTSQRPLDGPYALYLGKLAPNKGTSHLVRIAERAGLDWPLVIAGDGPERDQLTADAARSSRDVRLVGWLDQTGKHGVARSRVASGFHITRTRIPQSRAHRGQRAGSAHRGHEHRWNARHREGRGDGAAQRITGGAGGRCEAAADG